MHLILLWFAPLPPYHSPTSISPILSLSSVPFPLSLHVLHPLSPPLSPAFLSRASSRSFFLFVFSLCILKPHYVNTLLVRSLNYSLCDKEKASVCLVSSFTSVWLCDEVCTSLHCRIDMHAGVFMVKDRFGMCPHWLWNIFFLSMTKIQLNLWSAVWLRQINWIFPIVSLFSTRFLLCVFSRHCFLAELWLRGRDIGLLLECNSGCKPHSTLG